MNPLLVVGFDGMTWDVADDLDMPHLEKLTERGNRGELRSTYPPVTCPAWPTYLTGKNSTKHEMYDFASLDESGNVDLKSFSDFETPTLVDVMNTRDVPSIFFEIPLTYPAPSGLARVIAGYPARRDDQKFSDPALRDEIEDVFGEFPALSPTRFTGHNRQAVVDKYFEATRYRSRAFCKLLDDRDWRFATINFHLSDQFGHYFWDTYEDDPADSPLSQAYRTLDEILGQILETVPDSTNVMIVSDHGHGPQDRTVNLNYALMEGGFLELKSSVTTWVKTTLMKAGITPESVKQMLDTLNLTRLLGTLSRQTRDKLLDKFLSYKAVDWEETEAFAFGHMGQIYWMGDSPDRLEQLRSFLLEGSYAGEMKVDELFELREDTSASRRTPKWIVKMNDWANVAYPLLLGTWSITQEATYSGSHRMNGVLAFRGPDLAEDPPRDARLVDLAPTIHRLLDVPPQEDFDGRVLSEILSESAPDGLDPIDYDRAETTPADTGSDDERVEQLKNLGYL